MKTIKSLCFILVTTLIISACYTQPREPKEKWQVALQHDKDGTVLQGSKAQLFAAIRAGKTVRIGWGWYREDRQISIEHLADPIWLAIINEKEVIAHLEPQVLSGIDWEKGTASYEDEALMKQEWRVVINTNGAFDAVWYNREAQEVSRRVPQTQIMTWFVDELAPSDTKPLFDTN